MPAVDRHAAAMPAHPEPPAEARHQRPPGEPAMPAARPLIIPVFIPHMGCPHRCVFCNQVAVSRTLARLPSAGEIKRHVQRFLGYRGNRRGSTQIAFFGGNFLGLEADVVAGLLAIAGRFVADGDVDGIRFSTRPDTIDSARLDAIAGFPVATVELGVQSMDDRVLQKARRGHTAADTQSAVARLRQRNYEIGCQVMVGLPGDDVDGALASGRRVAALAPDFVRIYPTLVLTGSRLASWYHTSRYTPMALDPCIDLVKKLYLLFTEYGIRVIRMGLQSSPELDNGSAVLAGPYHPAFGHLVLSRLFLDRAVSDIQALISSGPSSPTAFILRVNPRDESRMRGLSGRNIAALEQIFPDHSLRIRSDASVLQGALEITATV